MTDNDTALIREKLYKVQYGNMRLAEMITIKTIIALLDEIDRLRLEVDSHE